MLLIPAIDIKDGKCVRLRQGKMDDVTVFADDPAEIAARWIEQGARRIHVVDLDGALNGEPTNAEVVKRICQVSGSVPVQVGGGIRDEDTVEAYLEAGVQYVVIGTKAVTAPHFVGDLCVEFPSHIIVGLDAKDGKVAIDGWSKLSNHDVIDLAQHFERDGVEAIIYTDISKDGMMQGASLESTRELASQITIPVILSGGVSGMADIEAACGLQDDGVMGAIIGRALYEGDLDLKTCQAYVDDKMGRE
ncbi:Phosphoribosylformimino-5-aminoimidazole carboxamide ribotide isomerase [Oceanococcus atlanticus]|uniref:1-(5-phosphoribosyl)-5-[(5-phosphoribosylamino)methylideneamino] imidazole-4-carboxamide isomerase n=1 Tax=Oceanococcus atlanticus TaxID=1317117 RepID=A0A1Y1SI89_9GAMM|nr:1-(5-phosphoribosyl)-5-[(5-phosphoribosylamino)methylideneamino]imidazole-4-carboxamide isomerase [Oceanococcus atlanticus]ORE89393.1 Phosphoribosylformimino-5-aminoimidazole carboxamide ribotide isomerase [Oceanococcus atlanticus]RZO84959.1 MAG: 1-(5-phosphoribosyl)-5-[(5-phosphoribosylamino)methylideneamino]imidazole-4-carboxamide isomerase [Oceanococcus sp.]